MAHEEDKPKLYCAWFCPFAERPWIALLHKGIDFEYIEQNPYNKTPEWLAINPRGLIPVIVHKGRSIVDSRICLEYIEDAWPVKRPLLPKDPYQRAYARQWCDHISKKVMPSDLELIMTQTSAAQEKAGKSLLDAFHQLNEAMDKEGPFFLGSELGMVDIMLAPFAFRIDTVLKHYRQFEIPQTEKFSRFHTWWEAVRNEESVKKTFPPVYKLIKFEENYVDDTATSELAVAFREGKALP